MQMYTNGWINKDFKNIFLIVLCPPGHPIFPIVLGSLTVYSLGEVLPDSSSFHSERFIYPAGFHSTRMYGSMKDPKKRCTYTCKIINSDGDAKVSGGSNHRGGGGGGGSSMLPYFGKRKQVTKVTFLVKEQNVSVIYTDINGISWCLT